MEWWRGGVGYIFHSFFLFVFSIFLVITKLEKKERKDTDREVEGRCCLFVCFHSFFLSFLFITKLIDEKIFGEKKEKIET